MRDIAISLTVIIDPIPAFRQMVLKHPESKDELNDVMTRIAYKWEANVEYDDEALTSESSLSDTDTHS